MYYGDHAKTFSVGKISSEKKKLMDITEESLYKGIEKAVPGNFVGDIGHAVQTHAESNGFSVVWEFAGWSDRHEDIGWLCARCWRFGNDQLPVGGLGTFSTFQKAYEDASGQSLNVTAIGYWQVMAEIRWAVIALQQAARNNSGQELSLELALSGYLVPEMEMNMLNLIDEIEQGIWTDLDS